MLSDSPGRTAGPSCVTLRACCNAGGSKRLAVGKSFAVISYSDEDDTSADGSGAPGSSESRQRLDSVRESEREGTESIEEIAEAAASSLRRPQAENSSDSSAAGRLEHEREQDLDGQSESGVDSVQGEAEGMSDEGWIGWAKGLLPWGKSKQAEDQSDSDTKPAKVMASLSRLETSMPADSMHATPSRVAIRSQVLLFSWLKPCLSFKETNAHWRCCLQKGKRMVCQPMRAAHAMQGEAKHAESTEADSSSSKEANRSWWSYLPFWQEESDVEAAEAEAKREAPFIFLCEAALRMVHVEQPALQLPALLARGEAMEAPEAKAKCGAVLSLAFLCCACVQGLRHC